MTYTNYFYCFVAVAAIVAFIVVAQRPENAGFRFFNPGAVLTCVAANVLLLTPVLLNYFGMAEGYSTKLILMMASGVALCVGLAVYNVRKTRLLFGLAGTLAQLAAYSLIFPVLLACLGVQFFSSTASALALPDDYDRVNDPDERFGVSEDELRGEGLFSPERMNADGY